MITTTRQLSLLTLTFVTTFCMGSMNSDLQIFESAKAQQSEDGQPIKRLRIRKRTYNLLNEGQVPSVEQQEEQSFTPEGSGLQEEVVEEQGDLRVSRLQAVIGYPKFDGQFSYKPTYTAFDQDYTNLGKVFSLSGYNLMNFEASGRVHFSPEWTLGIDLNYLGFATDSIDLGIFQVEESETSGVTTSIWGKYCRTKDDIRRRWCPFAGLTADRFYLLTFSGNTTLQLTNLTDMMLIAGLTYEFPVLEIISGNVTAGYGHGLVTGQSGASQIDSDSKYWVEGSMAYTYKPQYEIVTTLNYEARQAEFTTSSAAGDDIWQADTTNFGLFVGLRYLMR